MRADLLSVEAQIWPHGDADAKRFKELVNENGELKKMLADEMLKNRVLEESLKKSGKRLR